MLQCAIRHTRCSVILGLATATNGAISAVRQVFVRAKPHDFGLLGGREVWLEFIDSNPIA